MSNAIFINNIPNFNKSLLNENEKNIILYTKINICDIENILNSTIDKFDEKCKYYINYFDSYYSLSFKVDINQLDAMMETSVQINIYKNDVNDSIIVIDKNIDSHPEWKDIKKNLYKNLIKTN
jgi:hypothetical protein